MRSEEDVRETMQHADTMLDRFDEHNAHMESIGVGVIRETLKWVLEENESGDLLEELREDVALEDDDD